MAFVSQGIKCSRRDQLCLLEMILHVKFYFDQPAFPPYICKLTPMCGQPLLAMTGRSRLLNNQICRIVLTPFRKITCITPSSFVEGQGIPEVKTSTIC